MKRILSIILATVLLFGVSAPVTVHAETDERQPTKEWAAENGWTKSSSSYSFTKTIDNVNYELIHSITDYEDLIGGLHNKPDSHWFIAVRKSPDVSGVVTILGEIDGYPVKEISRSAFSWNEQITEVIIPEGMEVIGDSAFYICENLEKVSLPSTLKMIDVLAFDRCDSLSELTIPASVEYICDSAFYSNAILETGLDTLTFEGNAPEILYPSTSDEYPNFYSFRGTIYVCEGTTGWDSEAWRFLDCDLKTIGSANWVTLNRLLEEAGLLSEADYLPDTWAVLQEAIAASQGLEHADTDTVDEAIAVLSEALAELIVDRTDLNRLLEEAAPLIEEDYTPESWAVLQDAVTMAEGLTEHSDVESVRSATADLEKALENLVADRTELLFLYKSVDLLDESDYTDKSWQPIVEIIAHTTFDLVEGYLRNKPVSIISVEEVHEAEQTLREAIEDLELAEGIDTPSINKEGLEAVLEEASALEEVQYYTSESWAVLQEVIAVAKETRDTEDATAYDVVRATHSLSEAMENLVTYRTVLDRLLAESGLLAETDYTTESWAALQEAIAAAQELAEDANAEAVHNAVTDMEKALAGLIVDRTELNRILEEASLFTETDYTAESWSVLQEAIIAAEGLAENADIDTVHDVIAAIEKALENLVPDRTKLNHALEEASLLTETDYTPESWEALQEAVATAERLPENASVDAVHNAAAAIEKAIESLRADRTELDRLLEEIALLIETDYTPESWEALQEAISATERLPENASVEDVHGAVQAIREAAAALVLAAGIDFPSVNKEGLKAALEEASDLMEAYYTSDSWEDLQEAATAAKEVLEATEVTPADVINAIVSLQEAIAALVPVTPVWEIFTDVTEGQWYVDSVQHVYYKGIMEGNGDKFTPNSKMTRGMFVTTLYRLAGEPEVTDRLALTELNDISENAWYTDAVCWAYSTGITTGYESDMTFRTNVALTREQLAAFVYRYAQYQGMDVSISDDLSGLVNANKVKPYAEKEVKWAVGSGLISGLESADTNGATIYDLAPQGTATRSQMAAILMRFMQAYGGDHE